MVEKKRKPEIQPLGLVYSLTGYSLFFFLFSFFSYFLSSVVANPYSDVLRSLVLPLNGLPILGALKSETNLARLLFSF